MPSGHTVIALIVLSLSYRYARVLFYLFCPIVGALILSLVYLRYHYVIDLFAGAALAAGCSIIGPRSSRGWEGGGGQEKREACWNCTNSPKTGPAKMGESPEGRGGNEAQCFSHFFSKTSQCQVSEITSKKNLQILVAAGFSCALFIKDSPKLKLLNKVKRSQATKNTIFFASA